MPTVKPVISEGYNSLSNAGTRSDIGPSMAPPSSEEMPTTDLKCHNSTLRLAIPFSSSNGMTLKQPPPSRSTHTAASDQRAHVKQYFPLRLDTRLVSVSACCSYTLNNLAACIMDPKRVLEAKTLQFHLPDLNGTYVIANNMQPGYWREVREAPDPDNHQHDDPAPHRDGLKSLCFSIRENHQEQWEDFYLLPRHSLLRRRALALNLKPKDDRADFVDYFFDKNLESHLVPVAKLPQECGPVKIHQAMSGTALFKDDVSVSIVGLRVGSMTTMGWIYCGYWDHGNQFIPCDLIVSEKPETVANMARFASTHLGSLTEREAAEENMSSSDESSEGVVMRTTVNQDRLAYRFRKCETGA